MNSPNKSANAYGPAKLTCWALFGGRIGAAFPAAMTLPADTVHIDRLSAATSTRWAGHILKLPAPLTVWAGDLLRASHEAGSIADGTIECGHACYILPQRSGRYTLRMKNPAATGIAAGGSAPKLCRIRGLQV